MSGDARPPASRGLVKRAIARAARQDRVWRVIDWLMLRPARYAAAEREQVLVGRHTAALLARLFPDLTVRHGPFRGLVYPAAEAVCSQLLPKLLGSYECELHAAVERACAATPPLVVDVGCAEGYYAVGLARQLPAARVLAFDTDPAARRLCQAMAAANGVTDRLTVGGWCGPAELAAAVAGRPALVVCDCEGYEHTLLAGEAMPALAAAELLIETHEFFQPGVTADLAARFQATHHAATLSSVGDTAKARAGQYPEFDGLDPADRLELVAERRPEPMAWLHLTPLRPAAGRETE